MSVKMNLYKLKSVPIEAFKWTGHNYNELNRYFSNEGWRKLTLAADGSLHIIISQYPTRLARIGDYLFFAEDKQSIRIMSDAEFQSRYELVLAPTVSDVADSRPYAETIRVRAEPFHNEGQM